MADYKIEISCETTSLEFIKRLVAYVASRVTAARSPSDIASISGIGAGGEQYSVKFTFPVAAEVARLRAEADQLERDNK